MDMNEVKPNMYRVTYKVREGDNYAGGWGKRTADIESLNDLSRFDVIESVVPIYKVTTIFDDLALSKNQIESAIVDGRKSYEHEEKLRELKRAEDRLAKAKASI